MTESESSLSFTFYTPRTPPSSEESAQQSPTPARRGIREPFWKRASREVWEATSTASALRGAEDSSAPQRSMLPALPCQEALLSLTREFVQGQLSLGYHLSDFIEIYVNPLRELTHSPPSRRKRSWRRRSPTFSPRDCAKIFEGCVALFRLSCSFLRPLRTRLFVVDDLRSDSDWEYDLSIDEADFRDVRFLTVLRTILHGVDSIVPFLRMYRTIVGKVPDSFVLLSKIFFGEYRAADGTFLELLSDFDQKAETRHQQGASLRAHFLLFPECGWEGRLRLEAYLLLFPRQFFQMASFVTDLVALYDRHLEEGGSADAVVKGLLDTAQGSFDELGDPLRVKMKEIAQSAAMMAIQARFERPEHVPRRSREREFLVHVKERVLVHEGPVWEGVGSGVEEEEEGEGEDDRLRHFHLFNDVLVISKPNRAHRFRLCAHVGLLSLTIQTSGPSSPFLKVNDTVFMAQTLEERDRWLQTLSTAKSVAFRLKQGERGCFPPPRFEMDFQECLARCKIPSKPTAMLKYAVYRRGLLKNLFRKKPAMRKFLISQDNKMIQWGEPVFGRNRHSTDVIEVELDSASEIVLGQTTRAFKKDPRSAAVGLSFSILLGNDGFDRKFVWLGRSIDLICMCRRDFMIWTTALRGLIMKEYGDDTEDQLLDEQEELERIRFLELISRQYAGRMVDLRIGACNVSFSAYWLGLSEA